MLTRPAILNKGLPDGSGVYLFLDVSGTILYIGKATSLRDRVRSYFASDIATTRGPKIIRMLEQACDVKWRETDSVLEALLLESRLIREHWPPYNTDAKDDKSWNFVVATDEAFPRILVVRGRDLTERPETYAAKWTFGPFTSGGMLKTALAIIRKIFPYRDMCVPSESGRLCFNAQIGLCPGVCGGRVSAREYGRAVRHIKLFLEGKKTELTRQLKREMTRSAQKLEFERATIIKRQLFALEHVNDSTLIGKGWQEYSSGVGVSVDADFRIEAYDVAHLSGKETVGVMTVLTGGIPDKSHYRKFKLRSGNDDLRNLEEMLARRMRHSEWPSADLIVVDGSELQIRSARKVVREFGLSTPVVSVLKDERHKPKDILGMNDRARVHREAILLANAEAHRFAITFHRARRGKEFLSKK